MLTNKHAISVEDSPASFSLTSFHYGTRGSGKKVYIQASVHADEVPAMLVALTLWGYTHGAIQIAQTKESFLEEVGLSADEFLAHAIRFGLRGLEPPAATPARSTARTKPSRSRR